MKELQNSKIADVWNVFENLAHLPHGSGNEKAVSDYVLNYAKNLGLNAEQDEVYNVFIKVPASVGYENFEPIILQAHLDMVNDKNDDSTHDFLKDPLKLRVVDGWLMATDTTLGADDGIGVALILAYIARSDVQHPALEIVLTVQEETTMIGAKTFNTSKLKSKRIINLDNTKEDEMCIGCAGVATVNAYGDFELQNNTKDKLVMLKIFGMAGGHSGDAIHYRKSAFEYTARLLKELSKQFTFNIAKLTFGRATNAIARESETIISTNDDINKIKAFALNKIKEYRRELIDDNIDVLVEEVNTKLKPITARDTLRLINLLVALPQGVQSMTDDHNLPESSMNVGVVKIVDGKANFGITIRSSVKDKETYIVDKVTSIISAFGLKYDTPTSLPFFNTDPNSEMVKMSQKIYKELFGKDIILKRYHALMELGVFSEKINDLQGISISPTLVDIHSPQEKLDILSTEHAFIYLVKILENCKF